MYPTYCKRDIDRQTIDREDRQTMEREREREYRQATDTETDRKKHRNEERASSLRERM
jgi:hypothetical protein